MDPLRSNYKYTFENTDGTSKVIDFKESGLLISRLFFLIKV